MPIVVQHQPSLTKLGNLAYRTGQQQYADRRRQEEEARLMRERQMAMQQQQFGDKMAFDVWNRQFGQAGAMQQLMIQNQMQAQRDQRQQGFAMDRIGVGHQNNLALDEINNMQQQQRDERLQVEAERMRRERGEAAVQEEIRRQDQARDNEARQVQQRIDTAEVNRRFSNLNGNGREALAAELATQTELRINQSEMSPEDFESAWAESQERQAAIESDINNTRALEGEVGFKSPVPDRPNWYRVEQGPGKDPTYQFNFEEAYPELPDHASRLERFQKDFGLESEDGRRVFEPSLTDPNGGEWVDKPDELALQVANYRAEVAIPEARIDQEKSHLTDLLKRRTEIMGSEAYVNLASDDLEAKAEMVADVNADIDSTRVSISKLRDELDRIGARYTAPPEGAAAAGVGAAGVGAAGVGAAAGGVAGVGGAEAAWGGGGGGGGGFGGVGFGGGSSGAAPVDVVPEVAPEGAAVAGAGAAQVAGLRQQLGGPVPAGQGQGRAGEMIAPPAPNDATAERGSKHHPIATRTPEDAMALAAGQYYFAPADGNGNPIVLREGENPPEWIRMIKKPQSDPSSWTPWR